MIGAESGIDVAHLLEAAHEGSGGCQKNERDGDLSDNEHGAEASVATSGASRTAAFFQVFIHACVQRGKGRGQATERTSEESKDKREQDDARIEVNAIDARHGLWQKRHSDFERNRSEQKPEHASGPAKHNAFHKGVAYERPRRSAKGEPDRQLAPPANGADEQQARDIQARNEQHDEHRIGKNVDQRFSGAYC
jgi:hypothetical protein